ncbi:MAG: hypothetical protein IJF63_04130 [Alistipes sp.]|nr:hypothetical protein [Alistipes sp.]
MKAIFLACNQALYDEVQHEMARLCVRGYTSWEEVKGCGMATGEPHLGDAVWPTLNSAIISITEDDKADALLAAVRKIDEENPKLGLRAFWWSVGGTI